jgi:hypothetical protein
MSTSGGGRGPRVSMKSMEDWPHAAVFLLVAFRCWLAGYETGDVACWELAWQSVSRTVPLADAKRIVAELAQFTRVFRKTLACRFVYLPYCCARVSTDEHLAVRFIACAQLGEMTRAVELARKLSANDNHIELVNAACDLGAVLKQAELSLTNPKMLESGSMSRGDTFPTIRSGR